MTPTLEVEVEATPKCCGSEMKEERGFVSKKIIFRCVDCRKTDLRNYSRKN